MSQDAKLQELWDLRARVEKLETELALTQEAPNWPPHEFYTAYYVLAGFVLGGVGAMTSLLFNIIGSLAVGQHPLHLIRIYLTFPLGASALHLESGLTLAVGCCLYLLTGMALGVPFHLILSRWFDQASWTTKTLVATVLALSMWLVHYYGILSWLQPLLFGGDWILREIPVWVGAGTHLVFGWTMLVLQPLGRFAASR